MLQELPGQTPAGTNSGELDITDVVLATLYRRREQHIRMLRRRIGEADAEDVLQHVATRIFKTRVFYGGPEDERERLVLFVLGRQLTNACCDLLRKLYRRKRRFERLAAEWEVTHHG